MTGLPPNRQVDANDTDIGNYTAPQEDPIENVDYYQRVTLATSRRWASRSSRVAASSRVTRIGARSCDRQRDARRTFLKDRNPIGQQLRPCCGDQMPWFTVVGVAKDVKQGGVDQKTGTELYFLDQFASWPPTSGSAPATMNFVLRTRAADRDARDRDRGSVREFDPSLPVIKLRTMDGSSASR